MVTIAITTAVSDDGGSDSGGDGEEETETPIQSAGSLAGAAPQNCSPLLGIVPCP